MPAYRTLRRSSRPSPPSSSSSSDAPPPRQPSRRHSGWDRHNFTIAFGHYLSSHPIDASDIEARLENQPAALNMLRTAYSVAHLRSDVTRRRSSLQQLVNQMNRELDELEQQDGIFRHVEDGILQDLYAYRISPHLLYVEQENVPTRHHHAPATPSPTDRLFSRGPVEQPITQMMAELSIVESPTSESAVSSHLDSPVPAQYQYTTAPFIHHRDRPTPLSLLTAHVASSTTNVMNVPAPSNPADRPSSPELVDDNSAYSSDWDPNDASPVLGDLSPIVSNDHSSTPSGWITRRRDSTPHPSPPSPHRRRGTQRQDSNGTSGWAWK